MGVGSKEVDSDRKAKVRKSIAAFWCLGLLNNFLYVVMNAGANKINGAGVGLVYLANILPTLLVKLTGPYWFHKVPYKIRIWVSSVLMVMCLLIVAWAEDGKVKLLGVGLASLQSGIGEASLLAMASFYDSQKCLAGWSSGTGFAGIFGYVWSIVFTQGFDACFQLQLMVGLWIPIAFMAAFHLLLDEPWVDQERLAEVCPGEGGDTSDATSTDSDSIESNQSAVHQRPVTADLKCHQRFCFTLTLWKYMIPLFLVYSSEYIIQAGVWASMGFPVTDKKSRHEWYQWANFTYQVGVFISRSLGGLVVLSVPALWVGPLGQVLMLAFFYGIAAAATGGWWLIAPALVVGFLGGFVYVQAFVLISQREDPKYVELALSSASVADTFGIITADICAILVQGCLFGKLEITDPVPDFKCGYDIWENLNTNSTAAAPETFAKVCFPGVKG